MSTRDEDDGCMKSFLFEEWGIEESDLFECLTLPGREIICDFGSGAQGIVFMAEDGSFVKVTDDLSEVALAVLLRDKPVAQFPRVDDVFTFALGQTRLFAIFRESVDDFLSPFSEQHLEGPVIAAMLGAGRTTPPDYTALGRLSAISPSHHREICDLLVSLARVTASTGLEVSDLHAGNIGRTDDGRVVVRDFGYNNLSPEQIDRLIADIPVLPTMRVGMVA
ncbi:hypothetical protein G6L37_34895 [Agrobacterium rubi]|nr:hypothetical protein [Agrobacterium rubi]NTF23757.1 hypothetical protein [Agrobacterium rubi]